MCRYVVVNCKCYYYYFLFVLVIQSGLSALQGQSQLAVPPLHRRLCTCWPSPEFYKIVYNAMVHQWSWRLRLSLCRENGHREYSLLELSVQLIIYVFFTYKKALTFDCSHYYSIPGVLCHNQCIPAGFTCTVTALASSGLLASSESIKVFPRHKCLSCMHAPFRVWYIIKIYQIICCLY